MFTTESAYRHGVDYDDMVHALTLSAGFVSLADPDGAVMVMHVGPARDGSLLEIGVVAGRDLEGEVIVHAMPARRQYLAAVGLR